jgi:lantibiotic modifying enzyme
MKDQTLLIYFNTLLDTGCFDFLLPAARQDVGEVLDSLPEAERIVAPSAREDLERLLLERLRVLYAGLLISLLNQYLKTYDFAETLHPTGRNREALRRAAADLRRMLGGAGREGLFEEYVMLPGYEERIRENYKNHIRELLSRYLAKEAELGVRFFGGEVPGAILGFDASGADMHRRGRTVTQIRTRAGSCFYKPHDCGLDLFYRQVVSRWFSDCTEAPEVIPGDGYAFVSALTRRELPEEGAAVSYYYHFGILAAVLHGLGSNDMHAENVLPCGDRPCIVDMESVVSTHRKPPRQGISREEEADLLFRGLGASVLHVTFLPVRLHRGGVISPLYRGGGADGYLPFYGQARYTVEGFEPDFLRGFREGYRRMIGHRDDILALLSGCSGALVRIIPFNTLYYVRCRARLFSAQALRSPDEAEKVLADLALPFTWYGSEVNRNQLRLEAAALREGDVPYFCAPMCSCDLFGNDAGEPVQKDYLSLCADEYTRRSLARLSGRELAFEEELLKRCFTHAPLDVPVSEEEAAWPWAAPEAMPAEQAFRLGAGLFEEMLSDRFHLTDGTPVWLSWASPARYDTGGLDRLAGALLLAGRVLSCGMLSGLHGKAAAFVREAEESIGRQLSVFRRTDAQTLRTRGNLGLAAGLGSVLLSLGALAEKSAAAVREALLQYLEECEVWKTDRLDLQHGLAGLLAGMLSGGGTAHERMIRACAARLLEMPGEEPDGFTGLAGTGAALAAAYRALGEPAYAKGAAEAFARVGRQYVPALNGWPESGTVWRWAAGRAPKAAGIGLCALRALDALGGCPEAVPAREVLELAVKSQQDEAELYWNDSLYRGNALSVLFLTRAGKQLNDPALTERAGILLAGMNACREKYGAFHLMERGVRNCFDVSFPEGSSGIGYAALMYGESKL